MSKVHIDFSNISELEFSFNKEYELAIKYNNLNYYMKINLKEDNDKIVIFSNGAIDPKKSSPPVYMRSSWANDVNASCIFLDDPTLIGTSLRLGWGQGDLKNFHLENISIILRELLNLFGIDTKNTYFYGSSSGGYMSIYYSILLPGSTAIANNPQTKVLNYLAPFVKRMLSHSYNIDSIESVDSNLLYRLDLVEAIKYYDSIPKNIYYLQNYNCPADRQNHLSPFLHGLNENDIEITGMYLINYFKESFGHSPLPQNPTLRYIHLIMDGRMDMKI